VLSLACKGTETFGCDKKYDHPVSMGIIVKFTTRIVQFGFYSEKVTGLDDARVAFGEESRFIGTVDRVTVTPKSRASVGPTRSSAGLFGKCWAGKRRPGRLDFFLRPRPARSRRCQLLTPK
jgi:hypothetical protein